MKKLIFLFAVLFIVNQANAQVKFGIKAGLSTSKLATGDFEFFAPGSFESLKLGIQDANYGVHGGIFLRAKAGLLFIQPEVLFNSTSVDYRVSDFKDGIAFTNIVREKYQHIDIPVLVGIKLGPFRAGIGPVGKVLINHADRLTDIDGIKADFQDLTLAYQALLGLTFGKINLDFKIENSLNKFGDGLEIYGKQFDFGEQDKRMTFSLGYTF